MKVLFPFALLLTLLTSCASFQYKRGDVVYLGNETGIKDTVFFQAKLPFGLYQVYNDTDLDNPTTDLYVVRSKWVIPTEINPFDRRKINLMSSIKK